MSSTNQTRAITLQLPEEIYQQISQTADYECGDSKIFSAC